ncbi:MAG: cation diffusion facilitator family transporter [Methanobrevibacter sp.]|jgi:cation diffusion facilitator family transporter|nr:cation diffusion facilitator family transporter [Candidatus Methanovirga aequatorialis]
MDYDERNKEGKKAIKVGIVGNLFLTTLNILVGLITGSFALVVEGLHTFSDIATTIIAYIGFRVGQKPADYEHPLGHGRAESIAGLVIVLFLAFLSYEIISQGIEKLFFEEHFKKLSYLAGLMALIGIFINLTISNYVLKIGKRVNSPAIIADGKHQKTDVFSSIAILMGVISSNLGFGFLDPLIGLIIGVLILKTAFTLGKDNINNIMGKIPSEDLLNQVKEVTKSIDDVHGVHNIKINYFGSYATLDIHIDLNPDLTLKESHKIVHQTQDKLKKDIDIIQDVTAHACPFDEEYEH